MDERYEDVTVVIPAYNAARTLPVAVRSTECLPGCRVVVIDDGSTDATAQSIAHMSSVQLVSQDNRGASAARRRGLEIVRTEFVVYLDSDDEVTGGMRAAIHVLRQDSGAAVVGGRAVHLGADDAVLAPLSRGARARRLSFTDLVTHFYSPFPPAAAAWRTSALREAERSAPDWLRPAYAEDFELLIRTSMQGDVQQIDEETCRYRTVGGRSHANALAEVRDSERVRAHYAAFAGVPAQRLSERQMRDQAAWREFFATRTVVNPLRLFRYAVRERSHVAGGVRALLGRVVPW